MPSAAQNIRIRFSKQGDIRFISHHDLMRLFERAFRRARLPVAMTEGFNPRPRLSFPLALGVSIAGRAEVLDVALVRWLRPRDLKSRLQAELPDGIELLSAEAIPPNPDRQPTEISYAVPLLPGHSLAGGRLDELMERDELIVERRRKGKVKRVDIRPFLKALRIEGDELLVLLRNTDSGTARPEEVMEALGCREGTDYLLSQIERTHVRMRSPS